MLLAVTVVSALVHIYSISYMASDPHNQRFFAYLSMFTFFMLVLVAGDNYLILFVGQLPAEVQCELHVEHRYMLESPKALGTRINLQ